MKIDNTAMENAKTAAAKLYEAGFTTAADNLLKLATRAKKMADAYDLYPCLTAEHLKDYQALLKEKTTKTDSGGRGSYDEISFVKIGAYAGTPPEDVLAAVEHAKNQDIFDDFEVASLKTQRIAPDPIVFGIVKDCPDKFFVAEWGEDVKIEDILNLKVNDKKVKAK